MLKKIRKFFNHNKGVEDSKSQKSGWMKIGGFLINLAFVVFLSYFISSAVVSFLLNKIVPPVGGLDSIENIVHLLKIQIRKITILEGVINDFQIFEIDIEAFLILLLLFELLM